jgi:DNA-3-methyladenine glycosylase II
VELPTPKAILEYAERWRPWRSVASWYLWRVLDAEPD